jgi:ankyrin repeat protein
VTIDQAAAAADADAVFALLDADPSRATARAGRPSWPPLLHLCCSRQRRGDSGAAAARVRIARRLLDLGADVNESGFEDGFTSPNVTQMFDEHEWRPIEGAAGRTACAPLVRLLLDAGANLAKTGQALSMAVLGGDEDVLRALLAAAPRHWWQVRWALKACVVLDRIEFARLIVAATRDDDATQVGPDRALFEAIRLQRPPAWIELLIGNDAKPESTMTMRQAAYRLALHYRHDAAADILRRHGADDGAAAGVEASVAAVLARDRADDESPSPAVDPLLFERAADAVAAGDADTLRQLLDDTADLARARSPRPHRATLLIYCGANGVEEIRQRTPSNAPAIAQLLLERGADPNASCRLYGGGSTTLGLLLTSIHPRRAGVDGDLVRVLARFGAQVGLDDLIHAIETGASQAATALVEAGVPIGNAFAAAGVGRVEMIADCLARGADVNGRYTGWSSTPLHAAAGMGHAEAVRFLLACGADRTLRNVWGGTPAGTARYFGHDEVAALLEPQG